MDITYKLHDGYEMVINCAAIGPIHTQTVRHSAVQCPYSLSTVLGGIVRTESSKPDGIQCPLNPDLKAPVHFEVSSIRNGED